MKKRIFALIMVIVLLFAFQMPVFAASVQPRREFYLAMTMVAYRGAQTSSLGIDGHAFLYFYNDGDVAVQIGHWRLEPYSDMTIGTFGNRGVHHGIWYNIEAAAANSFSYASDLVTLTQMVDENQLNTLNSVINRNDDYGALQDNCVNFAVDVWDSIALNSEKMNLDSNLIGILTPRILINKIRTKSNYSNSFSMTQKSAQTIAYHTTNGYVYSPSGLYADN